MADSIEQMEERLALATDDAERARLLNELASGLSRTDPKRGLRYAGEARELACALGDRGAEAMSFQGIARCHETLSDYAAAMSAARSARDIYQEIGDRAGVANSLLSLGVIARGINDYAVALDALHEGLRIFQDLGQRSDMSRAYNNIGTVHEAMGNFSEALQLHLAGLHIDEELGDEQHAATLSNNIGSIYYYLSDHDRSFEYYTRSLDFFRRRNNSYAIALTLGNISAIYKAREDYDAALDALNEGLAILEPMEEKRYQAALLVKLGMLYELRGESKAAMDHIQRGARIAELVGSRDMIVDAQLRIGDIYYKRGNYRRALATLRKGLKLARETKLLKPECHFLLTLARTYNALGEHADAYEHLTQHVALQEKLFGEERQRAVAEMQARFDVERAEREREVFRLKSEHLEEMMEQRSKELTSMAMHLVQKNAFLQKLRKDGQELSRQHPASKAAIDQLLGQISENLHDGDSWQRFEQEFQLVHHDFIRTLSERYPRLTPGELKVCALLKINLSNKEIARLLSVSIRNVESHRYWIRKKMDLSSDINLSTYLAGL